MEALFEVGNIIEFVDKSNFDTYYGEIHFVDTNVNGEIIEYQVKGFKGKGVSVMIAVPQNCITGVFTRS